MAPFWKGTIGFGLVQITVRAVPAVEDHDVRFHMVHRADGGRIRQRKTCEVCGTTVEQDDIVRGYDTGGGQLVLLDDADFEGLPISSTKLAEVLEFVPVEQIDPVLYEKAYYLDPEGVAVKPYVLLRDALAAQDRVGIVKVTFRSREQLAALRVINRVMVLHTMRWPDEVRAAQFPSISDAAAPHAQELRMTSSLIDTMTGDFDPTAWRDEYRESVLAMIDRKVHGKETIVPPSPAEASGPGKVVSLMDALRDSVTRAQQAREDTTPPAKKAAKRARKSA